MEDPMVLAAEKAGLDLAALTAAAQGGEGEESEYDIWRSHVPLMYDFISETKLIWPSLTIEWLPLQEKLSTRQELLIGTHTDDEEQNYLKIASIELPEETVDPKYQVQDDDASETEPDVKSNIKVIQKFKHDYEVTRARYMPQNPNIIATINGRGTVSIFDRESNLTTASKQLSFHKDNGYGLSFNKNTQGLLLSGSDDHTVALWDIKSDNLEPVKVWENLHTDIVNDVKWHEFDKNLFGTVSEDCQLHIVDIRQDKTHSTTRTKDSFNTLAFSKHSSHLFAAGGTDAQVYLYDMRKVDTPLYTMEGHEDAITNLEFYNHKDGIILSSGMDKRLIMWDIMEIGKEQIGEDAEDASAEVMMIHAGHKTPINDFAINTNVPWLFACCDESNVAQVWKCSHNLPQICGTSNINTTLINEIIARNAD